MSFEEVLQICDTLRKQINEIFSKDFDLHLTISTGIAKYTVDMFAEDLLQNADTALYQAKSQRNHIMLYAGNSHQQTPLSLTISSVTLVNIFKDKICKLLSSILMSSYYKNI